MGVDPEAALPLDLADDRLQTLILDLDRRAAFPAHNVVMVLFRRAAHVGVVARWQIESLERVQLGQEIEIAKDGGAPEPQSSPARIFDEVRGREVASACRDQVRDRPARVRDPMTGTRDRREQISCRIGTRSAWHFHAPDDTQSRLGRGRGRRQRITYGQ
jgi:hypothetical protein